jgi:hypothetical protein
MLIYSIGKIFKLENRRGPLSPRPAQIDADPGPSLRVSQPASSLTRCQLPLPPNFLCSAPVCPRQPNSRRRAGHPSPPHATRKPTCSPAALSHHAGCGAPWRPTAAVLLLCYCPSLLQPGCRARSLTTKPHAACPTGRADAAESAPSRLRSSPAGVRA